MKKKKLITIIFLIIISVIVLAFILWLLFRPAKRLTNKLNKISNTTYNLEKANARYVRHGQCKVLVYPTTNLMELDMEPDLVRSDKNLFLYVGSSTSVDKGLISILVVPTTDVEYDLITKMNKSSNKISTEHNTLNYFVYDGKNYYYHLNSSGVMFTTPIDNNYLYWVMINNYKNLDVEDIESILHFEKY